MALSFHPELTEDTRLHEYYLKEVLNLWIQIIKGETWCVE
jgi:hypothetical protein